ncbi:hypothetical protein [Aquisalinus flavus]|uniref:Transmembrane protein n=1 Tax=Aquisalinus flavus TaxID=1526572 RepID=A0A8J2V2X4_9PROT|nr:hypothetical protein [Aquisalinus flavus]MBD0425477.1 hypothetical protein [Aquisalinus flavus]UNE48889.1 hypothetical protein FF099_12925 [Aquisalinus flavus]GGD15749.1 hypothetical protein GCM10011342_25660 [Aquisalinus flavus]
MTPDTTNMGEPVRLASAADIAALQWRSYRQRPVAVDLPGLGEKDRLAYSTRLNRLMAECGCNEGAVGLLLGAALGTIAALLAGMGWIAGIAVIVATSIALSGLFKFSKLSMAKAHFFSTLEELQALANDGDKPPKPAAGMTGRDSAMEAGNG